MAAGVRAGQCRAGRAARRAVLLAAWLPAAACTRWSAVPGAPGALAARGPVPRARVVLRDGRREELRRVAVAGDSVVGFRWRGETPGRVAFPVGEVARVERGRYSAGRTAGLLAGIGLGAAAAYFIAFAIAVGGDPNY